MTKAINLLKNILTDIKLDWKHQWQIVILSLIVFIYCIINIIKLILNAVDYIYILMFCILNKGKIYLAFVWKLNSNREKKVSYSFNDFKRRGMALSCSKKTISIIRKKYLQIPRWIYSLNHLYSFFKSDKKLCENKYFCNVVMPSKYTKLIGFNQYRKSHKAPFIIYSDHECLIEK